MGGTGRRLRRFLVSDRSMEPTLHAGQGLIAWRSSRSRVGQLRCIEHPGRPDFWLVKRVHDMPTTSTNDVRSDNTEIDTVDSATFGPVPVDGSYRVLLAIPLRWM